MKFAFIESRLQLMSSDRTSFAGSEAKTDLVDWDQFVAANPHGYHEQTSIYGDIRRQYGFNVEQVIIHENGTLVGGAQVQVQSTPVGRYAQINRAPLALNDSPAHHARVVSAIDSWARRNRIASVRVDLLPSQTAAQETLLSTGFAPSEAWGGRKRSYIIPITFSDEELLARVRRKTRYNMRVAQRAGVTTSFEDASAIPAFYELYLTSSRYHEFVPFPIDYFRYLWELFNPRGKAALLFAIYRERPIAALLSIISGDRLYASWTGTRRSESDPNLQTGGLLYYEMMRWARDRGCIMIDLQDDAAYKTLFANELLTWPTALRKYYGPTRVLRRYVLEKSSTESLLRRAVQKVIHRRNLRPRMPW